MNDRQCRTYDMFTSLRGWLTEHVDELPPEALPVLESFSSSLAEIGRNWGRQLTAAKRRPTTGARGDVDKMRLEQMLPLASLTRRLFVGESAIRDALRVPHKQASMEVILEAARLMVRTLKPHRAFIASAQIDAARLDRLTREVRRITKLMGTAREIATARRAPTQDIKTLLASAREDCNSLRALINAQGGSVYTVPWPALTRVKKKLGRPRTNRRPRTSKPTRSSNRHRAAA